MAWLPDSKSGQRAGNSDLRGQIKRVRAILSGEEETEMQCGSKTSHTEEVTAEAEGINYSLSPSPGQAKRSWLWRVERDADVKHEKKLLR